MSRWFERIWILIPVIFVGYVALILLSDIQSITDILITIFILALLTIGFGLDSDHFKIFSAKSKMKDRKDMTDQELIKRISNNINIRDISEEE